MATYSLTSGVLERIFASPNKPLEEPVVLQVLSIRELQPAQTATAQNKRIRVILSDGVHYAQSMIVTQLNNVVAEAHIRRHSVLRVTQYSMSVIQKRRLLIVLRIEPVSGPTEELERIGNPRTAVPGNVVPDDEPEAAAEPAPEPAPAPAADFIDIKPPLDALEMDKPMPAAPMAVAAPAPMAVAAPAPMAVGPADPEPLMEDDAEMTADHQHIYKIANLSPYQNKWTIRVRAVNKSDIRTWQNQRGKGKLFSVTFVDESGEIRATAFNEQVDLYYENIRENGVYYVSGAAIRVVRNPKYSHVNNEYEMALELKSVVVPCSDAEAALVPGLTYNFLELHRLDEKGKDETADVIAVVHECGDVGEIVTRQTQRTLHKRELTLVGADECQVKMTLWGAQADSFTVGPGTAYGEHPIVAVRGARVSDFGGRQLSVASTSTMTVNPEIKEAYHLRGWYDSTGSQITQWKTFTSAGGPGGNREVSYKTIQQIAGEEIGTGDKPDYFSVVAYVDHIRDETFAYPACPNDKCRKKVVQETTDQWRCESCMKTYPAPDYRYILSLAVADFSGQQWMTAFNEAGETLMLGHSANELAALRDAPDGDGRFKSLFQAACRREWVFRCRAKAEVYNETNKVRVAILEAQPVPYAAESRRLAELIKQFEALPALGAPADSAGAAGGWAPHYA